jgi:hypothetical protein
MKLRWKIGISIPVALLVAGVACWFTMPGFRDWVRVSMYFVIVETDLTLHPPPPRCKAREAEFNARVERIRQDAKDALKVGTKKEDVIRLFASEGISPSFSQMGAESWAQGEIDFRGDSACRSLACGDDSKLIGVRVDVDGDGTVVAEPVVATMYTDCL